MQEYFYLEEEGLEKSKFIDNRYMCKLRNVVFDVKLAPSCESSLFKEPTNKTLKICVIRITENEQPFWSLLITDGGWLFSLVNEEMAYLKCAKDIKGEYKLSGIGMIQMPEECTLETNIIKVLGFQTSKSELEYLYMPKIDLRLENLSDVCKEVKNEKKLWEEPNNWTVEDGKWSKIGGSGKGINGAHSKKLNKQSMYRHSSLGTSTILIIIIIVYCLCNCKKK